MSDNRWNTVGRGGSSGRGRPVGGAAGAAAAEFPADAAAAFGRKRGGYNNFKGEPLPRSSSSSQNTDFDSKAAVAFSRPKRTSDEKADRVFSPSAAAAFGSASSKHEQSGENRTNSTRNEFDDTASSAFGKSTTRSGFHDEMANIAFGKQRRTADREGGFTGPRTGNTMPSAIRNDLSSIVDSALGVAGTEVKSQWKGSALFKRKEPKKSASVAEKVDASNTLMFPSLGDSVGLVAPKPVKSFSAVLRDSIAVDEKSAEEKAAAAAAEETKNLSEAYDRRNYKMLGKRPTQSKSRTMSSESSDGEEEKTDFIEPYDFKRHSKKHIAPDVSASDYSEHPDEGVFHEEELAVAEDMDG